MIFKRAKYCLALLFILIWSACSHVSRHPLSQPQTLLLSSVLVPRAPLPLDALQPLHDYTADLRSEIERVVGAFGSEGITWGIKIISLDRNEIIYERDSSKLLMPASNLKIVTSAVALLRLRPDFVYDTIVQTDGHIRAGTLTGNLFIIGSGDPTISARMQGGDSTAIFKEWAGQLRALGIRKIDGTVIGVDSYFDEERTPAGWQPDQLNFSYAAEVSALEFNDNIIAVNVTPTRSRRRASIRLDPPTRYVHVENHVVTRKGRSDDFVAYRPQDSNTIVLRGTIGTLDRKSVRFMTVHQPAGYFAAVLQETLAKNGIGVRRARQATKEEGNSIRNDPGHFHVLFTHTSPLLWIIITEMLKNSQNLYAESLAKTVGAVTSQEGSYRMWKAAALEALVPWGINSNDVVLEDGSGLSQHDFVTPNALIRILAGMHSSPLFQAFYNSLPVAGLDGTLKNRMNETPAEGNVHAKTGYIDFVVSLSGYVTTKDGEHLAFVMIANNLNTSKYAVQSAMDSICVRLAEFSRHSQRR